MLKKEKLLVAGLGNPGDTYATTKHNAGFICVDLLAKSLGTAFKSSKKLLADIAESETLLILKPQTYMNESGASVQAALAYYKIPHGQLVVIHDDTDIPLGEFKVQRNRGAAGHNGVKSIIERLGTQDFTRIRIGVRPTGTTHKALDFVLAPSTKAELTALKEVCTKALASAGLI